ncbi:Zn-dependent peptidase ImmA (M78 family) [Aneurinibacillus soli]|uniref:Uncharacterized protein n=1 Tax=Aneurinibacillus soli TaxID=1500254 RepID=A0A0U5B7J7_9BACL|nr:terminase [Aneurinibacillus soli]PYE63477.1 Zn-dependent peptidase ImmA (M78 family) [Aneurinibacillus soli]BAU27590.1 hypothetical protein CB4_01764 [Aneurinibacillus soli]
MLHYYTKTDLESWIEEQYQQAGIVSPAHLSLSELCDVFGIYIDYTSGRSAAVWDDELAMVYLDRTLSVREQRAAFFHELCHPLRHTARQHERVPALRGVEEWQEMQASQFQLYASAPFYMVEQLDFTGRQVAATIAESFDLPYSLAWRRWEQIERRIFQARLDEEFQRYIEREDQMILFDRTVAQ